MRDEPANRPTTPEAIWTTPSRLVFDHHAFFGSMRNHAIFESQHMLMLGSFAVVNARYLIQKPRQ